MIACVTSDDTTRTALAQEIIGGTSDFGHPSVVSICERSGPAHSCTCTGTVIGPRTVLTAAHCVDPHIVGNQIFEIWSGRVPLDTGIVVSATKVAPGFTSSSVSAGHDVAVIHTASTLPFPLTLPAAADINQSVTLVGYGSDGTFASQGLKRQVVANIVPNETTSLLLADGNSSAMICFGDSGGPALQTINGQPAVVGVASFVAGGTPPDSCVARGYHARVDADLPFITSEAVDASDFLNWAEGNWPGLFPATQPNQIDGPFTWRFYPSTQNYLGVGNGRVYVAGASAGNPTSPVDFDALINYACRVYPASCP